jgi:hypothetical protein
LADGLKPGCNPNKNLIVLLAIRAPTSVASHSNISKFQIPEFRAQRLWNIPHASIKIVESREEN